MKWEECKKVFLLHTEAHDCLKEKHLSDCASGAEWATPIFSWNTIFTESITDKLWLFRFRYEADIFSENEPKISLSLQEKQMTAFVDSENWSFQVEIGILENFYLPLEIDSLLLHYHFSHEFSDDINKCEFLNVI